MRVLVVNPGSSSVKLRALDADDTVVVRRDVDTHHGELPLDAMAEVLDGLPPFDAVGVRVVHGGDITATTRVDDHVMARLEEAADLAPLHNPPALRVLHQLRQARPDVPLLVCLDTAFHATLPPAAATYAVPWEWIERWGIRRYGFHGLNHGYVAGRAADLLGRPVADLRVVTCHLGAGASLAAVAGGESVDTTMGFTPLDGLMMATRSGSVDPGAMLWLQERAGLTPAEMEHALDRQSGILGLSGTSAHLPDVLAAADAGDRRAALAVDVYVHRLRAGIASMAAAMDGLDAVVFTAGVGEGSPDIRARAAAGLGFLGVAVDAGANRAVPPEGDADITAPGAAAATLVIRAREDLAIAREVRRALA